MKQERARLFKRRTNCCLATLVILLAMLLPSVNLGFWLVKGEWSSTEPIYIRADGTIELSNAPLSTNDSTTSTSISFSTKIAGSPPMVTITGQLENMFKEPLKGELVYLYYTYPGAENWVPITTATTDNSGIFETIWFPPATGNYTITAGWEGNNAYAPAEAISNLDVSTSFLPLLSEPFFPFVVIAGLVITVFAIIVAVYYLRMRKQSLTTATKKTINQPSPKATPLLERNVAWLVQAYFSKD